MSNFGILIIINKLKKNDHFQLYQSLNQILIKEEEIF